MARGISIAGTSLPVTDASVSFTKDPVREQSMSGLGGEALYKGLYGPAQGSCSGAYRPSAFNTYIQQLYTVTPASYTIVVSDDHGNAFTSSTSYITSAEISLKAGELAKLNMSFVGKQDGFIWQLSISCGSVSPSGPYILYALNLICGSETLDIFRPMLSAMLS